VTGHRVGGAGRGAARRREDGHLRQGVTLPRRLGRTAADGTDDARRRPRQAPGDRDFPVMAPRAGVRLAHRLNLGAAEERSAYCFPGADGLQPVRPGSMLFLAPSGARNISPPGGFQTEYAHGKGSNRGGNGVTPGYLVAGRETSRPRRTTLFLVALLFL